MYEKVTSMTGDAQKSLSKLTTKYHCMVSGQKRMAPCAGCSNPSGCVSTTMQYKETEDMDQTSEKAIVKISADGEVAKCAKGDISACGYKGGKVCGKCGAMAVMEKDADADTDEKGGMGYGGMSQMEGMVEDDKKRRAARMRRLQAMGAKSADIDDNAYLCATERKVYGADSKVCATCPGGCKPESGLPTVLEIEGIAEDMFGAKVLDSGYGEKSDLFLVELERKDGRPMEAIFDGTTGECVSWQLLPTEALSMKSAINTTSIIAMDEAAEIAIKSIPGEVSAIDADIFDGIDSWVVEVDGYDGKSYDIFVSVNGGEIVGTDAYEAEEALEVEEFAAEYALKRAYSDNEREVMAERGFALPDGSFPIKDEEDLRNAVMAFGRAKDKEKAKAHIMKRAADLGMEELIPASWADKAMDEDGMEEESEMPEEEMMDDEEMKKGKKSDGEDQTDDSFIASLMEFQVLSTEADLEL